MAKLRQSTFVEADNAEMDHILHLGTGTARGRTENLRWTPWEESVRSGQRRAPDSIKEAEVPEGVHV